MSNYTLTELLRVYGADEVTTEQMLKMMRNVEPVKVVQTEDSKLAYVGKWENTTLSLINLVNDGVVTFESYEEFCDLYHNELHQGEPKPTRLSLALDYAAGRITDAELWETYSQVELPLHIKLNDGDSYYKGNEDNAAYAAAAVVAEQYGDEAYLNFHEQLLKMEEAFFAI